MLSKVSLNTYNLHRGRITALIIFDFFRQKLLTLNTFIHSKSFFFIESNQYRTLCFNRIVIFFNHYSFSFAFAIYKHCINVSELRRAIKNGQSRETGNTGHTIRRKKEKKNSKQYVLDTTIRKQTQIM